MSAPLAEALALGRRFGDFVALDRVDLEIRAGEVVGLLGANGAGKTTLIRILLGLLRPSSGASRLFGGRASRAGRTELGYVPQGLGLWEDLTIAENAAFVSAAFRSAEPRLDEEMSRLRDELVDGISLGLQRRLAFTLAISHKPRLLILDEPTSGVGPLGAAVLWDRIHGAAERGAGVLVSTHNMEEAEQCDRIIMLVSGRVRASGTIASVIGQRTVVEIRSDDWARAFAALDQAGFTASAHGRALRVSGAHTDQLREALGAAGVRAELRSVPANFEEAFVGLATHTPA